ncbi:hypothetical protein POVWA1_083740 [Plasmodium ovale wallikeri]|uniref:PIR Superfamily Protein n=1 Tax=Plasmodium ovale wallikeri TaxID=864142 RepID=A0A1A9ANK4_PLAOA|nr:hypothetical protein POVWA1_083740 [Plasmodium ovale wallikeri]
MGGEDDEEDGYVNGDNYYSSVSTFLQYENEFNRVTSESSSSKKHDADCNKISNDKFSSNGFSDRCDKVAKYLYYIKENDDNDNRYLFKAYEEISDKLKTCKPTISCIYEGDLGKIKKLYYLNEAMNKLEKSIEENDENIYINAEQFSQQYRNAISDCDSEDAYGYCGSLKEFEIFCNYQTKSKNCAEIAELIKYQHSLKKSVKIVVPCIMILAIPFFLYTLNKVNGYYIQNCLYI